MEDRSLELSLLPFEQPVKDPVEDAARLWSTLSEVHSDVNVLARSYPAVCVTEAQIDLINGLLQQIIQLVNVHDYAKNLRLVPKDECYTYGDLLLLLGHYKGVLRAFRMNVLAESGYSF